MKNQTGQRPSNKGFTGDGSSPASGDDSRSNQGKYEQLFNNLNDAVSLFEMNKDGLPGRYLEVNDTLCRWLDYTREELLALSPLDISEKTDDAVNRDIAVSFARNRHSVIERTLVAKNGRKIPVEVNFHFITYEGKERALSISRDISERKAAEAAQRESEEKFRSLIEQNLEGFSLIDETGTVIEWNSALEDMTGLKRTDAVGKPMWDVQALMRPDEMKSPGFYERIRKMIRSMIESGENPLLGKPFETPITRPDGSSAVIQQVVFPIKTKNGFRFGSIKRDITAQRETMQALIESEEKFRTTIEQCLEGVSIIDEKGIVLEWNHALESITGVSAGAAIGRPLWNVQEMMRPPNHRTVDRLEKSKANVLRALQHADSSFQGMLHEAVIYRPDGTPVNIQQTIFPIKTGIGMRLGSVIRDMTLQRKAQQALERSEELYRALVETTGTAYVVIDDSGTVLDANAEYVHLSGHKTLEEVRGKTVLEWTSEADKEKNREAIARCVLDGRIEGFEVEYVDQTGKATPIELTATVVKTGTTSQILTLCRDISNKKRIEENLNKAEKLESLGILAGGIAHDFNNLLTGIFGYIDIARLHNSSGAADRVSVNLSKALDVFNRARGLTQQLLTFSKGGSPVKKITALPPLLANATQFVLSGSTVNARFAFPDDLWPCEVDENQLGQVIDNIVINARQAMPTGGTVIVMAENISPGEPVPAPLVPGPYVRISIRDFGIGITREHLPHIFDPFFTTKQEGSGLGLATAYSIIKKHGGFIEAESELGNGTTIHIYLPATPSAAVETPGAGIKKHRGHGTVLVMDDEDFVRDVAAELLKTMGYSAAFATNGKDALEKYAETFASPSPFRAVILDLTLPGGMGGKETLAELLKVDPAIVAIAASGYSNDPVMTDPAAFGFKGKIRKPFTKEELAEVLDSVMKDV